MRPRPIAAAVLALALLAGCEALPSGGADAGEGETGIDRSLYRVSFEGPTIGGHSPAPELFEAPATVRWDGRPTLRGIWISHPLATRPERARLINPDTWRAADGVVFRREGGADPLISSEAAEALGVRPYRDTEVVVVALAPDPVTVPVPDLDDADAEVLVAEARGPAELTDAEREIAARRARALAASILRGGDGPGDLPARADVADGAEPPGAAGDDLPGTDVAAISPSPEYEGDVALADGDTAEADPFTEAEADGPADEPGGRIAATQTPRATAADGTAPAAEPDDRADDLPPADALVAAAPITGDAATVATGDPSTAEPPTTTNDAGQPEAGSPASAGAERAGAAEAGSRPEPAEASTGLGRIATAAPGNAASAAPLPASQLTFGSTRVASVPDPVIVAIARPRTAAPTPATPRETEAEPVRAPSTAPRDGALANGRFLRAGIFVDRTNVDALVAALTVEGFGARESETRFRGRDATLVTAGPFDTVAERDAALRLLRRHGITDALPVAE